MQTYPQLIGFNSTAYEYYVNQWSLCHYNMTLHYPAQAAYPIMGYPYQVSALAARDYEYKMHELRKLISLMSTSPELKEVVHGGVLYRRQSPAPIIISANSSTVDPQYGCGVWASLISYATSLSPWGQSRTTTRSWF